MLPPVRLTQRPPCLQPADGYGSSLPAPLPPAPAPGPGYQGLYSRGPQYSASYPPPGIPPPQYGGRGYAGAPGGRGPPPPQAYGRQGAPGPSQVCESSYDVTLHVVGSQAYGRPRGPDAPAGCSSCCRKLDEDAWNEGPPPSLRSQAVRLRAQPACVAAAAR